MVTVDPVALRTLSHTRAALKLSIALSLATLAIQLALHWASPQFDPSWRMVSEYANGNSAWLLTLMFLCWAASSLLLVHGLLRHATSLTLKLGIAFLIIAGIGEAMGGAFDINHPWHMLAAILGMNGLPIAALLIGWGLARSGHPKWLRLAGVLPLLGVVLMAGAMAHFFAGLSRAGIAMSSNSKPLERLPDGVTAFNGWANRFLVVAFCAWAIVTAWHLIGQRRDMEN
jgi:hypothetical membrane protein